jgi:type I restriction enzyme, R subunit
MFNEANSVEAFVRDILGGNDKQRGLGWEFVSHKDLPRTVSDVLVDEHLREALIRLNPEIAQDATRADEVFYRLRADSSKPTKNSLSGSAASGRCHSAKIISTRRCA